MADPNVVDLFENPNAPTDMRFEVEGEIIPFYKALLSISSPVFGRMLTTDFKEAQTNTVQLPDKKSDEIIFFLEQLHPAHAWKPLTEERLECLLRLADEYDVAHVKMKCQAFIREQLEFALTTEQVLKYLWLCDTYSLDEVRADLTTVAVDHTLMQLEACSYFSKLNMSTQLEVTRKLCQSLQNEKDTALKTFINTADVDVLSEFHLCRAELQGPSFTHFVTGTVMAKKILGDSLYKWRLAVIIFAKLQLIVSIVEFLEHANLLGESKG